jgi:hypothetical protein
VCFPEVVAKRDDYYKLWQSDTGNLKWNMRHLILAVNTYVPPLRLTAIEMIVWRSRKQPPVDDQNYIWEHRKDNWAFVIGWDKIESKRRKAAKKRGKDVKRDIFLLDEELPGLKGQGKILNRIITQSLKAYPRTHLFIGIRNKQQMSPISYAQALTHIFKPKSVTQTLLRKSFVNHFYRQGLSYENLTKLASRMRHSVNFAQQSYMKLNI